MPDRWVIDEDYPDGRLVAMTPAEEAQHAKDQAAGFAAEAALALVAEKEAARIVTLRKAREDLAAGSLFKSLSDREKRVLDALLARDG